MKKKKLIGLASLMFVLGAVGCGETTTDEEKCPGGKHTWGDAVTLKEATCTETGESQRTCTVCGEKEKVKTVKALGHDFKDQAEGKVDATCTAVGNKVQKCSRCNETKNVEIPALGHDWVDDETGRVEPTCTQPGSKNQHCSRCTEVQTGVEIAATGHTFSDWAIVEGKEPTCEGKGEQKRTCSVCNEVETQEVDPLGHNAVLEGDPVTPAAGKAAVNVYACTNGCGQKFFGFKANEVTDESKEHLNFTEPNEKNEVGASFWGRPIGNSLALDSTGTSVHQTPNEVVYCSTETGDFFEYVFDLTEAQAAELATCRCYCDAKPADYLNGGDFWAYNASSDDWTPGYYIDGGEGHYEVDGEGQPQMVQDHERCEKSSASEGDAIPDSSVKMGKRITDYRYILYVDGNPVEFDKDIKVPTEGNNTNMVRKEYVMPYTFNLHAGENRISLRMAGGYRSTFYNFIFRPFVAPTEITVNETELTMNEGATGQITGAPEGVTYTSDKPEIATVDANGLVTGVKAGTATITVAKEGNYKAAKVQVTVNSVAHVHAFGTPADVAGAEGTAVPYTKADCACGDVKLTIDASKDMNGKISERGKKLGATGDTAKYVINTDKAYDGKLYLYAGVDTNGNQEYGFHTGKNGGSSAVDLPDGKTNTEFYVNGNKVNVSTAKYKDFGITGKFDAATMANVALIEVGDVALVNGSNEITMTRKDSFGVNVWDVVFIGGEHVHNFGETGTDVAEGATDAAVKRYECGCGVVKYEIDVKTAQMQLSGTWKNDPTSGVFKLNGNGDSTTFTFALPKGFTGKMYQRAYMDSYNQQKEKSMFYATDNVANIEVKVNDNAIDFSGLKDVTFGQVFGDELNGTNSTVKDVYLGDVTLNAANTVSYKRIKTLNQLVSAFVFVGTEVDA